ncbi:glutathione S-transferase [Neptuniibacter sp. QD72_48]|uniref:glutathione S-transferase n=1 Tax=unclassified Neptuniibacter TaxID=2630693 RepID=UPI0039F5E734
MNRPILYSFRRCPYAIRARLAIEQSGVEVELREIVLRDKPEHMLEISPKGTVPVLLLPDGTVIDESLEIMHWALAQNDCDAWHDADSKQIDQLIEANDYEFKGWLDKYKYSDRHPEHSQTYYRNKCELWLVQLEELLQQHSGSLLAGGKSLADYALLPFIRQFAHVNLDWFKAADYPHVQSWLSDFKESDLFLGVMKKYKPWKESQELIVFPE